MMRMSRFTALTASLQIISAGSANEWNYGRRQAEGLLKGRQRSEGTLRALTGQPLRRLLNSPTCNQLLLSAGIIGYLSMDNSRYLCCTNSFVHPAKLDHIRSALSHDPTFSLTELGKSLFSKIYFFNIRLVSA
jgi:hypothetical protein